METLLFRDGGLYSYLGMRDLVEIERRIQSGDARARNVFEGMIYQIGKEVGGMAAVLRGQVDAVLFTGGMAHSQRLVSALGGYASWIAPVKVYPGEDELQALTEGVLRVLRGEEHPRFLTARRELVGAVT